MTVRERLGWFGASFVWSPFMRLLHPSVSLDGLAQYPADAAAELRRRMHDTELRRRVETYLGDDIPPYMRGEPVLCLARYMATPNFETLRFLTMTEPLGFSAVVTEDTTDRFSPHNNLKRALCKLPLIDRIHQKHGKLHERFRPLSIVDFSAAEGARLSEIQTLWGEPLHEFHRSLLMHIAGRPVQVEDDTAWIDRNGRGNLLELYKRYLALFVVHGILFEDYVLSDKQDAEFVRTVVRPAARFVEETFGHAPLIAELVPPTFESNTFWISYPKRVRDVVDERRLRASLC